MKQALLFLVLLAFLFSCSSYQGNQQYFDRENVDCDLKILQNFPNKRGDYEIIGTCKGRGAVLIDDGSGKAFDRVAKCACRHGGNAIVLNKIKTTGFSDEDYNTDQRYIQNTGKVFEATVIRLTTL